MNLQHRTTRWLVLVTVVLMAAAVAGCIGDDGGDAPAETNDQAEDLQAANATETTDAENRTGAEDPEPTIEARTVALNGSGTGQGLEPMEGSCFSCFWIQSEGTSHDLTVPEAYEGGSIEFSWEGGESVGGMWLWIRDADQNTVHVFHVSESPFEVELEVNDARFDGAAEVVILPADVPAAAHVDVSWQGAVTFQALVDGGDEASGTGS